MRLSDRVSLIKKGKKKYDPDRGEYVDSSERWDNYPCHISDLGVDRTQQLFGDYRPQVKVVRLQRPFRAFEVDTVKIDGKEYTVRSVRLDDRVFYVEAVNHDGRL